MCTLDSTQRQARREALLPGLVRHATNHEAIDGGLRFHFPPSAVTLSAVAQAIDAERQCCRFLRFQVIAEPDEGPISMDVTGPDGTAGFLADLLAGA